MNFPDDLKYVKSHEWARIEGDVVTIGITDFAQSELGDVVFVDITASVGDELGEGDVFGTIEAVKTVSDLYMPISGTIAEINSNIGDAPESINTDPYGDGWLIKISNADTSSPALIDAAEYSGMVGS